MSAETPRPPLAERCGFCRDGVYVFRGIETRCPYCDGSGRVSQGIPATEEA